MSRNIPVVGRYLVNLWRDGRCVGSTKVLAPTKFLAKLAAREAIWSDRDLVAVFCTADKITITRMRKAS
jgi:hypothetical protein